MPSVDIASGLASQAMPGAETDPYAVAMGWVDQGADWLHIVDLDRAFRRGNNDAVIRDLIDAVPVPVQLSGGLEDERSIGGALATAAARVNVASTSLSDPALIAALSAQHGSRLVLGLDVAGEQVVARGSGVGLGPLREVIPLVAATGVTEFLVADATRDGSRRGSDLAMFESVTGNLRSVVPQARIVASGGVSSIADLAALSGLSGAGLWAVVLGAAVHQGNFTVREALRAVAL